MSKVRVRKFIQPLLLLVLGIGGCGTDQAVTDPQPVVALQWVIGTGDGPEFGSVDQAEFLQDGSIAILDGMREKIAVVDASGESWGEFGREGRAPDEFRSIVGLWVTRDGEIGVVDQGNRRITVWNRDGTLLRSAPLDNRMVLAVVSRGGTAFIKAAAQQGQGLGFYRIGTDLVVRDSPSVAFASSTGADFSCRFCASAAVHEGGFIVGGALTDYRVTWLGPAGVIEQWHRDIEPVRKSGEEIRRLEERMTAAAAAAGVAYEAPIHRPWFPRQAFGIDADDRVWTLRAAESGSAIDVFEIGRAAPVWTLSVPNQRHLHGIRMHGHSLIGLGTTPDGVPAVYSYSIGV